MCKITFTCPFVCMILHSIIADAAILRDQCHPYNHINFFQEQGNGHPSIFYGHLEHLLIGSFPHSVDNIIPLLLNHFTNQTFLFTHTI